ncbi:hypothetical protein V6N12_074460 [Hibiscus sabdariffa]|uniref:Uncharacterized protein n=1 Tax=Hibiscus sabdariffa TaxID=183260 RepID=A0ABR2BLG8_9ROSI
MEQSNVVLGKCCSQFPCMQSIKTLCADFDFILSKFGGRSQKVIPLEQLDKACGGWHWLFSSPSSSSSSSDSYFLGDLQHFSSSFVHFSSPIILTSNRTRVHSDQLNSLLTQSLLFAFGPPQAIPILPLHSPNLPFHFSRGPLAFTTTLNPLLNSLFRARHFA